MIITKTLDIRITYRNIEYYKNMGYDTFLGDVLTIPIAIVHKTSNSVIEIMCDGCNTIKEVRINTYLNYRNDNFGDYTCIKCAQVKRRESNIKKNGYSSPWESNDPDKIAYMKERSVEGKKQKSKDRTFMLTIFNELKDFKFDSDIDEKEKGG